MPVCEKITGKKRLVCAGEMNRLITIFDKDIQGKAIDNWDYKLTPFAEVFAMIQTTKGNEILGGLERPTYGSNVESVGIQNSYFYIRYLDGIQSHFTILYNENFYKILEIENLDDRNEFLLIRCAKRGGVNIKRSLL